MVRHGRCGEPLHEHVRTQVSRLSLPEVHRTIRVPRGGRWIPKLLAFTGPGYMVSVGYMDPGNWATDLAGGAQFGYTLLSVILISNIMAVDPPGARRAAGDRHGPRPRAIVPRGISTARRAFCCGSRARPPSSPAISPR